METGAPGPPEIAARKERLRREMRAARAGLAEEERVRLGALATEALLELPDVAAARTVLLFYAVGSEVPTRQAAARLLELGKGVLLPYLTADGSMEAAEIREGESLEPSGYGPREPSSRVPVDPASIDVVIAPGLAFDRAGRRLGYGGGQFDRYLRRLGPRATRIGLAFSIQVVDQVPVGPGDEPVHLVVTDRGALDVRPVQ